MRALMPLKEISIKDATMNPFTTVYSDWLIVSAGTPKKVNMMVAAWGAFGNIWTKPSVTIYVRESRYTKEFLDNNDTFGISVLPASYRKEMNLIGTKSGRNIDKFKATGLTPLFVDGTPVLKEAKLAFTADKALVQFLSPQSFTDPEAKKKWYSKGELNMNYHTMYIGEITHTLKDPDAQ